jgi:hypothetical protein
MNSSPSPDQIIEALRFFEEDRPFPREHVLAAIAQREAMTPLLLAELESMGRNPEAVLDHEALHLYAMYLLSYFREPLALPLFIRFFSFPGEAALDATGDLVAEDLGRMLASVCAGNTASIEAFIEDEAVHEAVRAAALDAFVVLVAAGLMPRAAVVEFFRALFSSRLRREPSGVWAGLLMACVDLHPGDWMPELRRAFKEGLFTDLAYSLDEVEACARLDRDAVLLDLREEWRLIGDPVEEMSWWACFPQDGGGQSDEAPDFSAQRTRP